MVSELFELSISEVSIVLIKETENVREIAKTDLANI